MNFSAKHLHDGVGIDYPISSPTGRSRREVMRLLRRLWHRVTRYNGESCEDCDSRYDAFLWTAPKELCWNLATERRVMSDDLTNHPLYEPERRSIPAERKQAMKKQVENTTRRHTVKRIIWLVLHHPRYAWIRFTHLGL